MCYAQDRISDSCSTEIAQRWAHKEGRVSSHPDPASPYYLSHPSLESFSLPDPPCPRLPPPSPCLALPAKPLGQSSFPPTAAARSHPKPWPAGASDATRAPSHAACSVQSARTPTRAKAPPAGYGGGGPGGGRTPPGGGSQLAGLGRPESARGPEYGTHVRGCAGPARAPRI